MAVSDTIFDEGGAVYNVKSSEYGATGSGGVDDRAKIQNAIDDAAANGGGMVFLPPGEYRIDDTLNLKPNVSLLGAGRGASTILLNTGGTPGFYVRTVSGEKATNVRLSDFAISAEGKEAAEVGHAIVMKRTTGTVIERVTVWKMPTARCGIYCQEEVNSTTFRDCHFRHIDGHAIQFSGFSNNNRVENCLFIADTSFNNMAGVFLDGYDASAERPNHRVTGTTISGCSFQGAGFETAPGSGVFYDGGNVAIFCNGAKLVLIQGNFIEWWRGAAIAAVAGSASNLHIVSNHIHAKATAGAAIKLNSSSGTNEHVHITNNFFKIDGSGDASTGVLVGSTTDCLGDFNEPADIMS